MDADGQRRLREDLDGIRWYCSLVMSDVVHGAARSFAFGPFTLVPARQLLLRGDSPVRIGGRALDLLTALVERPGELVSKRELMARAWPNIVVDESNLK